MSDDKCPKCGGYLYRGWHTNCPGSAIGKDADDLICLMTGPLREDNAALEQRLAQAQARIAELEAERRAVYAMGESPVEQAERVPFVQWVQTRLMPVAQHNMVVTRLEARAEKAEAACAGMRAYVAGPVVVTGDDEILARVRERDALLAQPNPGQPLLDELKRLRGIVGAIDRLRAAEGNVVAIICPNPDFNGLPAQAIEATRCWGDKWQTRRFTGETLAECLAIAEAAAEAARKGKT